VTERSDALTQLSRQLAARAAQARASVAGIRGTHHLVSAIVWRSDVLVTSAQSLARRDSYELLMPGGGTAQGILAGSDPSTNIAAVRVSPALPAPPLSAHPPALGELALAYGMDHAGEACARLGVVSAVGEAWQSAGGGQIERRIVLDLRLGPSEEGGPVFDSAGGFIGMSTFGPQQRVIAIPAATLERVVPVLVRDGHIALGWLGVALQPVAVPEAFRAGSGQTAAFMAMSVESDGPAAKAGIVAGDIVLSVDGQPTQRLRDLRSRLGPDSVGRRIELRLVRAGAVQVVPLTVEARPGG
jgi:S1-C subfamily serine protease